MKAEIITNRARLILFFLGISLITLSGYVTYTNYNFASSAIITRGTVIEKIKEELADNKKRYHGKLEYQDHKSKTRFFITDSLGTSFSAYNKGDTHDVAFNPEMPSEAKIHSFRSLWAASIVWFIFGTLMLIGSITYKAKTKEPGLIDHKHE